MVSCSRRSPGWALRSSQVGGAVPFQQDAAGAISWALHRHVDRLVGLGERATTLRPLRAGMRNRAARSTAAAVPRSAHRCAPRLPARGSPSAPPDPCAASARHRARFGGCNQDARHHVPRPPDAEGVAGTSARTRWRGCRPRNAQRRVRGDPRPGPGALLDFLDERSTDNNGAMSPGLVAVGRRPSGRSSDYSTPAAGEEAVERPRGVLVGGARPPCSNNGVGVGLTPTMVQTESHLRVWIRDQSRAPPENASRAPGVVVSAGRQRAGGSAANAPPASNKPAHRQDRAHRLPWSARALRPGAAADLHGRPPAALNCAFRPPTTMLRPPSRQRSRAPARCSVMTSWIRAGGCLRRPGRDRRRDLRDADGVGGADRR